MHGTLPDGTGYTAVVYNDALYRLRGSPPGAWYRRIRVGGGPAPRRLAQQLWRAYATHFSREYIFPGNASLMDILAFAYAVPSSSRLYLVRTMTGFLRDLGEVKAGKRIDVEWRDITPELPRENVTVPLACAVLRQGSGSESLGRGYVGCLLESLVSGTGFASTSTAVLGVAALGESILYRYGSAAVSLLPRYWPAGCIEAPGTVEPGYAPGYAPDIVVTLVDVRRSNGHWVVRPFAVFLPSLRLEPDYNHMARRKWRSPSPAPGEWRSFLWHRLVLDTRVTLYNGGLPPGTMKRFGLCGRALPVDEPGLPCLMVDYYLPYLTSFMQRMGLLGGGGAGGLEGILGRATRDGYQALALEAYGVVSGAVHTSLLGMDEGMLFASNVYSGYYSATVHVVVEKDTVPGVAGLRPLLGRLLVVVDGRDP